MRKIFPIIKRTLALYRKFVKYWKMFLQNTSLLVLSFKNAYKFWSLNFGVFVPIFLGVYMLCTCVLSSVVSSSFLYEV